MKRSRFTEQQSFEPEPTSSILIWDLEGLATLHSRFLKVLITALYTHLK